jgi:predicted  nucleic acid-binding Zn-ribbon protein
MVEMTMDREKSTDDRLSDLDKKVDVGFAQVGKEFEKVDERFVSIDERFEKVDERFVSIDERFEKVDERFDKVEGKIDSGFVELRGEMSSLKKSLFTASVSVIVALIGCCATLAVVAIAVH